MRVRTCPLFLNGIVLLKTGFVAGSLLSGHVNQWHIHFAPHSSVRRVESILQANTCCLPSITSFHCALCCSYFKLRLVLGEFSPLPFFYPLTVSRQRFLPEETRRRVGNCFQTGLEGWSIYIFFCFDLLDWTGAAAGLACARP